MDPANPFCPAQRRHGHWIRYSGVVLAMARQCARAAEITRARVINRRETRRRRHVVGVEIDQVLRVGHAMRVVAGRARGFLIHYVETMSAILPLAVDRPETLITQNTFAAVALVTQRVVCRAFRGVIREDQLAFKQRRINRTMRPIRAGPARCRALVAIVAIGARHQARGRPGRQQARNIAIFSHCLDRVKRLVRNPKLNPLIGFLDLAVHSRRPARYAVAMAAKA